MNNNSIDVTSEIGKLEGVIIHTPGSEVENMTPENAQRALYSDILNLSVASKEYRQLKDFLKTVTTTYEVRDLLATTLSDKRACENLVREVCFREETPELIDFLLDMNPAQLSSQLIEGVVLKRDNLTRFLSNERYALRPLHNFLFTRDASMSLWNEVLIGKMANKVRDRESLIMETIFRHHPLFGVTTYNPERMVSNENLLRNISIEGGDVQIARENVIVIGTGTRTTTEGIDFLTEIIREKKKGVYHILVQELPHTPESFIHLDMTFTFLDKDSCMIYEPLIKSNTKYHTIHIVVDNGKVTSIREESNLLLGLRSAGIELEPVTCGGHGDPWTMEREQWHSGANFFAVAPGKVVGYERNERTLEEMNRSGFEIIRAQDVIDGKSDIQNKKRAVITFAGAELARGGGGARCLTMPVKRQKVDW